MSNTLPREINIVLLHPSANFSGNFSREGLKNKLPVIPQQKPFASLFNIGRAKSLEELSHFFLDFWQSNGVVVFSHGLEPGDEHFIGFLGTNHRSCPYVHCQWSTCSKKGFIDHWETLMHFYTH